MTVRKDPPPTHLLRAFAVLVRMRNFRRTGEELGLSQSAVSQRIAVLEARLGVTLYDRECNEPTAAGRAYHAEVVPLLDSLVDAEARLIAAWSPRPDDVVRISVAASLARCWLAPRLPRLTSRLGGTSIALHVSDALVSLEKSGHDLAIRIRPGAATGGECLTRGRDRLLAIAPAGFVMRSAGDPFAGVMLFDDDCSALGVRARSTWREWYRANGYAFPETRPMTICNDAGMIVEAVRSGLGIGLVRASLVRDDLGAGRLSEVGAPIESIGQTWLVERGGGHRKTDLVAQWIHDAARTELA